MSASDVGSIYASRTRKSRALYAKAARLFPGGINHNIRYFEPHPFFVTRSKGKKLYDSDGNSYTDYWMGHWALILGHSPPEVSSALARQAKNGTLVGTANTASIELADLIQKLAPGAELMRFSSTGSEATMYATRLARAKTGRRVIAKAIGGWHGFNDALLQTVNYPFEADEGPGLLQDEGQFVESIPFNDLESSLKILETIKDDLACIIIEPLLAGAGCIPSNDDYLKGLQEFANKNGSLFILDEIVTGFRLTLGTAAGLYGLQPDLFTLGKIVGGGMPIGVVCGKKEIMSLADPVQRKEKQVRCAIGGGTFSANPMTMVAGAATLEFLKKNKLRVYSKLERLGEAARLGIQKIFDDSGIACRVTGAGSLFMPHFLAAGQQDIVNATDVALSNRSTLLSYHMALMSLNNIFFLPGKLGAFSFAHDQTDLWKLLEASRSFARSLKPAVKNA
ncbi:MAG: aspartate aminotransferase family protein [Nitrososphaera sp.]|jgi:glutamate-1-semialdehyde 2,1-aminomutase